MNLTVEHRDETYFSFYYNASEYVGFYVVDADGDAHGPFSTQRDAEMAIKMLPL